MSFTPGQIIHYIEMCSEEGVNLQRGMNFRLHGGPSIILMSLRKNAPYADRVEDEGRTLIYEGHDIPRTPGAPYPKSVDQPIRNPSGTPTENGKFYDAAKRHKMHKGDQETILRVFAHSCVKRFRRRSSSSDSGHTDRIVGAPVTTMVKHGNPLRLFAIGSKRHLNRNRRT